MIDMLLFLILYSINPSCLPTSVWGWPLQHTQEGSSLVLSKPAPYFSFIFVGLWSLTIFFCDLPPLMSLSCSSTFLSQVVNFLVVCAVGGTSALVVLVSYGYIIAAVMKIHSVHGRMKAFNTCASHLTTVILFYGSGLFSYLHSNAGYSQNKNKVVSVFYGAVIPMLNLSSIA